MGEISWKSAVAAAAVVVGEGYGDSEDDGATAPTSEMYGLFQRALDNMIDRALLPLSIVRFG
ncbi:hypothetical protein GGF37_007126, partial [Kickxella alabastrina]